MKNKTDAEVIIDGKRLKLSGYESEDYLQKVASYINGKIAELKSMDGYRRFDPDTKVLLTEINLADDYFKMKRSLTEVTNERDALNDEIYNLKHDIIEYQKQLEELKNDQKTKLADAQKKATKLNSDLVEEQKKTVKLETENAGLKDRLAKEQQMVEKLGDENAELRNENAGLKRRFQK